MKSLLQFLLLIALVLVGKTAKNQAQLAAKPAAPVHQHVESIQSFFVQHVSYKPVSVGAASASVGYSRKTNPVSLN